MCVGGVPWVRGRVVATTPFWMVMPPAGRVVFVSIKLWTVRQPVTAPQQIAENQTSPKRVGTSAAPHAAIRVAPRVPKPYENPGKLGVARGP